MGSGPTFDVLLAQAGLILANAKNVLDLKTRHVVFAAPDLATATFLPEAAKLLVIAKTMTVYSPAQTMP